MSLWSDHIFSEFHELNLLLSGRMNDEHAMRLEHQPSSHPVSSETEA